VKQLLRNWISSNWLDLLSTIYLLFALSFLFGNHLFRIKLSRRHRQNTRFAKQPSRPIWRLCTNAQPVFNSIWFYTNVFASIFVRYRIECAYNVKVLSIPWRPWICYYHPIKRTMYLPKSGQADSNKPHCDFHRSRNRIPTESRNIYKHIYIFKTDYSPSRCMVISQEINLFISVTLHPKRAPEVYDFVHVYNMDI